jgi:acyl-CoA thioesterase
MADESDLISELRNAEKTEPIAISLGMKLVELEPGRAVVKMTVGSGHINFNGVVSGGVITALSDQAFAYASNSMARHSLAAQLNIYFISAAKPGDELTAEGKVIKSGRRIGISEMTVTNQTGKIIARATGMTVPVE